MEDAPACVVLAAAVGHRGLDVLLQGLGTRVKLSRPAAGAQAGGAKPQPRVVGFTEPAQIGRSVVPLVSVAVVYHQETSRAA